jgi:hypothetical protein
MANLMTPSINPNITTTQSNTPTAPDWYNNYLSSLVPQVNNAITSGGAAGPSGLQTAAFNAAPTAINAGQPALNAATNITAGVAATPTSSLVGQYMDPYTQGVINSVGTLAKRNFNEFTAPSVNAAGVATGQFGGSRAMDINAKAARDSADNATALESQLLNNQFNNALTAAGNEQNLRLNAGNALTNQSNAAQGQATSGLSALSTLGGTQNALAQNALDYPMKALQSGASVINGTNIPVGTTSRVTGPAGQGNLGPSQFGQISQVGTGLGALLNSNLGGMLGGNTVGGSALSWLQKLLSGGGNAPTYTNQYPTGYGTPMYSGDTGIGMQDSQGFLWDGSRFVDQRTFEEQFGPVAE